MKGHHATSGGAWLVTWKKATGRQVVSYEDAVVEALRFGWIDSVARRLDEHRTMLWFGPRKHGSGWARSNKERIAQLEREGRLALAGAAVVAAAKADGSWSLLEDVEALIVPPDLDHALDREPGARANWDAFPPVRSARLSAVDRAGQAPGHEAARRSARNERLQGR